MRKTWPTWVLAALAGVAITGCETAGPPTRVILFIGDGAGTGHWTAARIVRDSLTVDAFPVTGLVDTRGDGQLVTGSAPAATAYATGWRSKKPMVGMDSDSVPHTSALEYARARGLSTGLVTTTFLTDATPAAFAAHSPNRDHLAIARQYADEQITVLLGGGREVFAAPDGSLSPLARMREHYDYVESADALTRLDVDTVTALLGLFAEGNMPQAPDRRPSLAQLTRAAIAILDRNPRGFFLLVENEETDEQAHHNAPFQAIADEMLALDDAIRVAVEYRTRQPNTLIIVTGDHETGGIAVNEDADGQPVLRYTTFGHTADMVPLFANGPSAERFGGLIRNDELGRNLIALIRRGGGT